MAISKNAAFKALYKSLLGLRALMPLFVFAAVVLPLAGMATEKKSEGAKILLIDSYTSANYLSKQFTTAFEAEIKSKNASIKINTVELGIFRLGGAEMFENGIKQVLDKVNADKPDLIVVFGLPAARVLKDAYLDELKDFPILICGYPAYLDFTKEKYPNIAVVKENFDILANVNFGMKLFPKTEEIVIVSDSGPLGASINEYAQEQLRDFDKNVKVHFMSGTQHDTEELLELLRGLKENSFIIYCGWRSNKPEVFFTQLSYLRIVAENANKPILTPYYGDTNAIFGGIVSSTIEDGRLSAETALKILAKEPLPSTSLTSKNFPLVNWGALIGHGLSESDVPPNTVFFNKPESVWVLHKSLMLNIGFAFAALSVFIAFLIVRNRMLVRNNAILKKIPVEVAAFDEKGKLVFGRGMDTCSSISELADMAPSIRSVFMESIAATASTGREITIEYDCCGAKNKAIFSRLPRKIFGNNLVLVASMDVSDLNAARQRERAIAEYLRITIESVGEGFIAADPDGVITMFNGEAERLMGIKREAAIGKKINEVYAPREAGGAFYFEVGRRYRTLNIRDGFVY